MVALIELTWGTRAWSNNQQRLEDLQHRTRIIERRKAYLHSTRLFDLVQGLRSIFQSELVILKRTDELKRNLEEKTFPITIDEFQFLLRMPLVNLNFFVYPKFILLRHSSLVDAIESRQGRVSLQELGANNAVLVNLMRNPPVRCVDFLVFNGILQPQDLPLKEMEFEDMNVMVEKFVTLLEEEFNTSPVSPASIRWFTESSESESSESSESSS
jgi:hypothetical protein